MTESHLRLAQEDKPFDLRRGNGNLSEGLETQIDKGHVSSL
jgi:FKBP-type peptidyl-prolyl cis-trans isomerase 2